jgi:hypothetical protein
MERTLIGGSAPCGSQELILQVLNSPFVIQIFFEKGIHNELVTNVLHSYQVLSKDGKSSIRNPLMNVPLYQ